METSRCAAPANVLRGTIAFERAATVCCKVPAKLRRRSLAFEHHKLVAKYDHAMQDKWLALAEKHGMEAR